MPVTEIVVVRHAQRKQWIVDTVDQTYLPVQENPTSISTDPALTVHGIAQSQELSVALESIFPFRPTTNNLSIFCSPYYRCLETIAPTVGALQARGWSGKVHIESGFAEWFGTAPFNHPYPLDAATLNSRFFKFVHPTYQSQAPFNPGAETYDELRRRTEIALNASINQAEQSSHGEKTTLLIVAHTAVVIMIGRILSKSWPEDHGADDFLCNLAGISRYERLQDKEADSVQWKISMNSDCSHLSGGAQGNWWFGSNHVQDQRVVRGPDKHRFMTNEYTLE